MKGRARTPEGQVKAALRDEAKYLRVRLWAIVGGPLQTPGISDYVGLKLGRFIGVECKSGKNKLTAAQAEFKAQVEREGGLFVEYRQPGDLAAALGVKILIA
jgi:hypothetical protein